MVHKGSVLKERKANLVSRYVNSDDEMSCFCQVVLAHYKEYQIPQVWDPVTVNLGQYEWQRFMFVSRKDE